MYGCQEGLALLAHDKLPWGVVLKAFAVESIYLFFFLGGGGIHSTYR